jgi:multidrug efflux pump subunit AcrA (membrane-fusion protein)
MKIIDPSSMEVEATINQSESGSFRIGQNARVGVDAFPGLELTAKLFSIGALASSPGREQYFIRNVPIRVQIRQQDKRVIPDLSASADVSIGRAQGVLIAPASAVEQKEGKAFVYVKSEQGFERRPVEVGPGNGTLVAVRTGLKEGDIIRTN